MNIKQAILKSLEDLNKPATSADIYDHIVTKKYYEFTRGETPLNTVSSRVGDFIRKKDIRVKRTKQGASYFYYLAKDEQNIGIELLINESENTSPKIIRAENSKTYEERDLHKLLSSYLKSTGIYSKTIFHEQSMYGKDSNQIWTHPDMVGIRFLKLQSKASEIFLKAVNQLDTFKINSFEIKREINSDNELKKAFFQAVSNSSWANYAYLVAFEFSDSLNEEIERLNQSFGIGVIELSANPYESKILFQPQYRDLDFKTIDKLCRMNKEFEKFIEQTEKLMTAEDKYYKPLEKEFNDFCDNYFTTDLEIEKYCKDKNIPTE